MPDLITAATDYAIGVARVSDAIQTTIPMQHRRIQERARLLGIEIPPDGLYSDIESRTNDLSAREGFQVALKRMSDPNCKVVIFWNDSRLLGDEQQALTLVRHFRKAQVRVFYADGTEEDVDSRMGVLFAVMKGWQNKNEVERTRDRVRDTLRDMAAEGRMVSRPPYVIRVVPLNEAPCGGSCKGDPQICGTRHGELSKKNTVWIVDENELAVLDLMYKHMAEGNTWGSLERRLATAGILTRKRVITRSKTNVGREVGGQPWLKHALRRLLLNPFYMGMFVWNQTRIARDDDNVKTIIDLPRDEWVMVPHSLGPLVDPELWERAFEMIERRKRTRDEQRKYPLMLWDGFIFDGRCGWKMTPRRRANKTKTFGALGGSEYDFACHGTYNPYCSCTVNHVIPDRALDRAMGGTLESKLMPHFAVTFESENEAATSTAELASVQAKLLQLAARRDRVEELYEMGNLTREKAQARFNRIEAEEEESRAREKELLVAPPAEIVSTDVPAALAALWPQLRNEDIPIELRRASLAAIVDRVIVDRPRLRVVLRKMPGQGLEA